MTINDATKSLSQRHSVWAIITLFLALSPSLVQGFAVRSHLCRRGTSRPQQLIHSDHDNNNSKKNKNYYFCKSPTQRITSSCIILQQAAGGSMEDMSEEDEVYEVLARDQAEEAAAAAASNELFPPKQPAHGNKESPLSSFIEIPGQRFQLAETKENYIPLAENQRLVCVGDIHGDLLALQDFLTISGVLEMVDKDGTTSTSSTTTEEEVVPEKKSFFPGGGYRTPYGRRRAQDSNKIPKWVGKDTILVQCGDILDRGSDELACFELLANLSQQAVQDGGKVILLYGNHEALNAMGLFQYATTDLEYERVMGQMVDSQLIDAIKNKSKEEDEEVQMPMWRTQYVGNQPARWATFEPQGLLANPLLANMKVAVQVGRTVCVHAGLTADHLRENGGLDGLNALARAFALGETLQDHVAYNNQGDYPSFQQPWVDAEHRQTTYINSIPSFLGGGIGAVSPVWMRDYSSPADGPPKNPKAMTMIDEALAEIGDCDRMVMGHTVQQKINCALDGKAWRIDVGASRGVLAGTPEVLEVVQTPEGEVVTVLTHNHGRIPGVERQVLAMVGLF